MYNLLVVQTDHQLWILKGPSHLRTSTPTSIWFSHISPPKLRLKNVRAMPKSEAACQKKHGQNIEKLDISMKLKAPPKQYPVSQVLHGFESRE